MLEPILAAGTLDQDAAHGLRRRGKEVPAAVPLLSLPLAHQAQVRLVDQGGGLQRLPWLFLSQALSGELAELVVDQGQELFRGGWVALLDGGQDACDVVAHGGTGTERGGELGPSIAARAAVCHCQSHMTTYRVG